MSAPLDVLWVGPWEPAELEDVETRGDLSLDRVLSALRAVHALSRRPARLVLVAGDDVEGREDEAVAALRAAGAGDVVLVYRPPLAHRAAQASDRGATAALTLPLHPGALTALVDSLLARAPHVGPERHADVTPRGAPPPTASPPSPPPPAVTGEPSPAPPPRRAPSATPDRSTLETLIGDAALVHRAVGDLDRLLDQVLASFQRRSTATRCSLLLVDSARNELVMQRADGLPDRDAWKPVPLGDGFAGRVASTGRPLLVRDLKQVGAGHDATPRRRPGYRTDSCLVLPLTATEGVAGVVCLADKADGTPFEESDLRSLMFLADQSGQALENALKLRHMQDLAVIDELTGLYNRRYFQRALEREVQRARRYDRPLTLAIMDLDLFKQFNDRCGHPAGDRALALVGEILRTALREVDIVARHGGEEFAVILPETSATETDGSKNPFPFLERLRKQVEVANIEGEEKLPSGKLTISIGVACFPADATTAEDLFQKADDALYESKSRGRNTVTYRGRAVG